MIPVDVLGLTAFGAIIVAGWIGGLTGAFVGAVLIVALFSLIIGG